MTPDSMVKATLGFTITGSVKLYGLFAFVHVASELTMPPTLVRVGNCEGDEDVGVGVGPDGVDEAVTGGGGVGVSVGAGEAATAEFCALLKFTLPANSNPLIMSATKNAFRSDSAIVKSIPR